MFNVYGPGQNMKDLNQGMVSIYLSQFLNKNINNVVIKGSLDRYRDFIYVKDVVKIINDSILNIKFFNTIINLGTGKKISIQYLLNTINKLGNFNKNIIVENEIIGDMKGCYSDNNKLLNIYNNNIIFTPIEIGIKEMIDYYTVKCLS